MTDGLGTAKYEMRPRLRLPDIYEEAAELVNDGFMRVYEWGRKYCGVTEDNLVQIYAWGRETQKLLAEERLNIEAEIDDLMRKKAPVDLVRAAMQRWADNVCELYQRHFDYRRQQGRRRARRVA